MASLVSAPRACRNTLAGTVVGVASRDDTGLWRSEGDIRKSLCGDVPMSRLISARKLRVTKIDAGADTDSGAIYGTLSASSTLIVDRELSRLESCDRSFSASDTGSPGRRWRRRWKTNTPARKRMNASKESGTAIAALSRAPRTALDCRCGSLGGEGVTADGVALEVIMIDDCATDD
jgi:hypothetical protein